MIAWFLVALTLAVAAPGVPQTSPDLRQQETVPIYAAENRASILLDYLRMWYWDDVLLRIGCNQESLCYVKLLYHGEMLLICERSCLVFAHRRRP